MHAGREEQDEREFHAHWKGRGRKRKERQRLWLEHTSDAAIQAGLCKVHADGSKTVWTLLQRKLDNVDVLGQSLGSVPKTVRLTGDAKRELLDSEFNVFQASELSKFGGGA